MLVRGFVCRWGETGLVVLCTWVLSGVFGGDRTEGSIGIQTAFSQRNQNKFPGSGPGLGLGWTLGSELGSRFGTRLGVRFGTHIV